MTTPLVNSAVNAGASRFEAGRKVDAELVAAFISGDEKAFSTLYVRHYKFILKITSTLLTPGNGVNPEDLAQDVFFKAFLRIEQYDPASTFTGWIRAIAFNLVKDAHKRKKPYQLTGKEILPDQRIGSQPDLSTEGRELRDRIVRTLTALSPIERRFIILRYVKDLTVQEIGKREGMSEAASKMRMHRSRLAFMKHFGAIR